MKKIFILLSLLMTMFVEAVAQNDAMFVYRNDGVINAFLKTDIDSIRHSNLDVDSVLHKEYVVQEVWTVDSVYRIPLAIIDSVSFVTPPTVYKDGVVKIGEELLKYVIGAEELTLQLYSNIPSSLIPHTDDLLILLEGCEVLPNGFSGKVKSVNAHSDCIEVVCEQAYIEDIFDSFCSVQTVVGYADNNENDPSLRSSSFAKRAIYNPKDIVFHLGPFSTSLNADISKKIIPNGDLALKGGLDGSISFKPTFRIHTFVLVGDGQGLYFNSSITGNLEVSSLLSIYGGLEWEHNFMDPEVAIPIPSTGGLLSFYINPGYFTRANALITGNITARVNYSFGMGFDYSSECESLIKTSIGGCLASSSTDIEGCIDGSIAVGGFIETGICLAVKKLNSRRIGYRGEYGVQARGNFVLTNSDIKNAEKETVVYERLKASSLEWGPFVNASYINASLQTQGSISWQISRAEKTWDIVPTFKNTKLTHTSSIATSADAYSELSGNCFIPVIPVGYKLFDGIMNEVADYDALYFTNKECLMEHRFDNLSRDKNYTLYPTVSLFGYEMLASPSAKLTTNTHAAITRFDVTNSEYKSGAFMNDGLYYDYKFNVSLTVEIDNLDGVEDWGYVYRDPYGNIKRISLMKHGFSYTDTDYVYYRNEAHSTACLYTYVKYEGDSEYYDGEPHEYELHYDEPIPITERAENIEHTAADIICTYKNVPADSECGVLVSWNYGEWTKMFPVTIENSTEETKTIQITELEPGHYYNYHAYISTNDGIYYEGEDKQFRTTSDPPIFTTGGAWEITSSSAIVSCSFQNVTEGMICGVQVSWNYGDSNRYFQCESKEGTHTITLTGLPSETVFWYRAYATDETGFYMDSNHGEFTTY